MSNKRFGLVLLLTLGACAPSSWPSDKLAADCARLEGNAASAKYAEACRIDLAYERRRERLAALQAAQLAYGGSHIVSVPQAYRIPDYRALATAFKQE